MTSDEQLSILCELAEVYQALSRLWPGYVNDPVDVDREGCWV